MPAILTVLQSNTILGLFVGQNVITLRAVDSTNEYLKGELSKSTPFAEGTVIMAVNQFDGRGQKGASWHSQPGKNLTFSLLLTPTFLSPKHQFRLTIAISLALVQWLEALLSRPVKIKWPNDIYVDGKKIAGILIENSIKGQTWKVAVVGIGINVNQTLFPPEIADRTCSIKQFLHTDSNIPELLSDLCCYLEDAYRTLGSGGHITQRAKYHQHLYRLGESHPFLVDGVRVIGRLHGVTEEGRLLIDFNGHVVDFDIKELEFVF